jgi:hypothetical protein
MRTIVCTLAVLASVLASSAPAGAAHRQAIAFSIQNVGDAFAACPGALFGFSFDMIAPDGAPLGSGRSCVTSQTGCSFTGRCRDTARATFVLDLPSGSVTARMVLRETWPTDSLVLQRGNGRVTSGTGGYVGATGRIVGGGAIQFTESGESPLLVYDLRV